MIYFYAGSVKYAFISFLSGIFIDLDHFLDYYLHKGVNLDIKDFYRCCVNEESEIFLVIFHSLELIILLWFVIGIFRLGPFWVFLTFGLTQHMVLDLIANQVRPIGYFMFYRMWKRFKFKELMKFRGR